MDFNSIETQINDSINKLNRALSYETQFRNAVVSDSISFYDVNLSKDLIENDFFFKETDDNLKSVLETVGLTAPCKFTDFIEHWTEVMIPESSRNMLCNLENIRDTLIQHYNEGKREYTVEYWAETPEGRNYFLNQQFLLVQNENQEICALSIVKDYTNSHSAREQLHHNQIEQYAYLDPITGGYNYNKFKEKVRRQKIPGSIISLNIHSFKIINSVCGIAKGDEVIKRIWECIMSTIDRDAGDLAAHINADHFIMYFQTFEHAVIIQKLKNLTYALNLISADLDVPQLQPYFGIAKWNQEKRIELSYSEALAAKQTNTDQLKVNYAFFEEADTERLIEEKRITDNFESALASKNFKIWYQPKFSPNSNKLVGAEALVRWQKDDGTLLPPVSFIPVYERNGQIRTLDEYVFRNVCIQQKKWQEEGKPIVPVSINLSRASLYFRTVVAEYKRIAKEIGVETKYLPIEITESAAVNNKEIKDIADDFYNAGFALHMDDFGTGYSSLSSLNLMHFETLKLDKSLVDFIGNYGGNRLIEHTICLAKDLGIQVTAEGVENSDQVTFLQHSGCDSIQGYYYSKPLPVEDFEKLLIDRKEEKQEPPMDERIATHLTQFKSSRMRTPIYTFVINLTKDSFIQIHSLTTTNWKEETKIDTNSYQESVQIIADNFVSTDYKAAFHHYMDRDNLLNNFFGDEETVFFSIKRKFLDKEILMRIMTNLFKIEDSDDVYMFLNVSILD